MLKCLCLKEKEKQGKKIFNQDHQSTKKQKRGAVLLFVFSLIIFSLAGYFAYQNYLKDQKKDQQTEAEVVQKLEEGRTEDKSSVESSKETVKDTETSVLITLPKEGANILANRTITGRSKNTGGTIYYYLSGSESGLVAQGSINTSDEGGYKDFTGTIQFSRKSVSGDTGTLSLTIKKDGAEKEVAKVGVNF